MGRLALIVGEDAPLDLPFTFALNPQGQSLEAVEFAFERHGPLTHLTISGQALQFSTDLDGPAEVIISSGNSQSWDFQLVQLTRGGLGADGGNGRAQTGPDRSAGALFSPQSKKRTKGTTSALTEADLLAQNTKAEGDLSLNKKASAGLEIFTPPMVRLGRAEAARLTAAQLRNQ